MKIWQEVWRRTMEWLRNNKEVMFIVVVVLVLVVVVRMMKFIFLHI